MARRATTRSSDDAQTPRLRAVPSREAAADGRAASAARSESGPRVAPRARLGFVTIAAWLAVAGVALLFVVPPAGLVCLVAAAVAGALAALTPHREVEPEPTADPRER
jgi:Flp pilus assembly protein TadB